MYTMDELRALHSDLPELPAEQAARRRKRNALLVFRLAPGRSCKQIVLLESGVIMRVRKATFLSPAILRKLLPRRRR